MLDTATFKTVLRGYDPEQVASTMKELKGALVAARRDAAERTSELAKVQAGFDDSKQELDAALERITELERQHKGSESPGFDELGTRVSAILTLAKEEAAELRGSAETTAAQVREESDRYAAKVRQTADAHAAGLVADATVTAQAVRDAAEAAARTRRQELEGWLESLRSQADDLAEQIDGTRRDSAAEAERIVAEATAAAAQATNRARQEAAATLTAARTEAAETTSGAQHEAHAVTAEARERAEATTYEAQHQCERVLADAHAEAETIVESHRATASSVAEFAGTLHGHAARLAKGQARVAQLSQDEMALITQQAQEQTERIRNDTEHKLAAVTARRHGIEAQLVAVRELLERLGTDASAATFDAATARPSARDGEQAGAQNGTSPTGRASSQLLPGQDAARPAGPGGVEAALQNAHVEPAAPAVVPGPMDRPAEDAAPAKATSSEASPAPAAAGTAPQHTKAAPQRTEARPDSSAPSAPPAPPRFRRLHTARASRSSAAARNVGSSRRDENEIDDSFEGDPFSASGDYR